MAILLPQRTVHTGRVFTGIIVATNVISGNLGAKPLDFAFKLEKLVIAVVFSVHYRS
jgi:hypothetical protein